jgi:hypothetical protein
VVHGAWCLALGALCMVHGAWCAWCLVCMVHGAWCAVALLQQPYRNCTAGAVRHARVHPQRPVTAPLTALLLLHMCRCTAAPQLLHHQLLDLQLCRPAAVAHVPPHRCTTTVAPQLLDLQLYRPAAVAHVPLYRCTTVVAPQLLHLYRNCTDLSQELYATLAYIRNGAPPAPPVALVGSTSPPKPGPPKPGPPKPGFDSYTEEYLWKLDTLQVGS